VRYLRVGTSSSTVRQAERGNSAISLSSAGEPYIPHIVEANNSQLARRGAAWAA
jgi:hypothetical protein